MRSGTTKRAYEIHTFWDGRWKIDSIYDDCDLAVSVAERIDGSGRYTAVRVIMELFDPNTSLTRTRTIFRSAKLKKSHEKAREKSMEARQQRLVERRRPAAELRKRKRQHQHRMKRRKLEPYRWALLFILLVTVGIAALMGLQHVRELL